MTADKNSLKFIFGVVIFMFSLALAYFTANYVRSQNIFDYWGTLLIFGGTYIIVGALVYGIFPVSLGFLFSADVLILHLMYENFGTIPNLAKTLIIGCILAILYLIASMDSEKHPEPPIMAPPPAPPITPQI